MPYTGTEHTILRGKEDVFSEEKQDKQPDTQGTE